MGRRGGIGPGARRPTSDHKPASPRGKGWLMNTLRCLSLVLIGACIALALPSSSLAAGEPATVTVRVEGPGGNTLLAQSEVTTTTAPVPVTGGTCSGTR